MQKFLLLLILFLPLSFSGTLAENPVDTILHRAERFLRNTAALPDVTKTMAALDEKKQWPDIDYTNQAPSGWKAAAHLQRLRSMALAWTHPRSPLFKKASLKNAIDAALNHWLEMRYQNPNWWHNAIGVPRMMQDIIVLLRHDLSPDQFKQAMEVLRQHKVGGTGANLVWSADLGLHYGALSGDVSMIKKCGDLISNEIKITTGEGIQPDFSYHQHGPRLQTYHYGSAFLRENIKLAWELSGTPWAFPEEKTDVLVNYILQGWQWMARGLYTVPGTIDRAVSREGALRGADLRHMIPYLLQLKPERSDAFRALADRQDGNGKQLQGFKHYPYSDFSAYHHTDFSFFVKTISTRTRFSESINRENLKGKLLNSGDTYFLRDGLEYYDLMPHWNWNYLPGITGFPGGETKQQNFAGGVGNGKSGLTVMRYNAENGEKKLSVKKFWASHGDKVVCLMADFETQNIDTLYTVLDQSRWRGDAVVDHPGNVLGKGLHVLENAGWIHHAGFAYIPLSPSNIVLHLKSVTGTWSSVNQSGSDQPASEHIFMPVLRHDLPSRASGYMVASCKTAREAGALKEKPGFAVTRNDGTCQSVVFSDGTLMASFFAPGSVTLKDKTELSVDRPCLLLVSRNKVYLSDPAHTGGSIELRIGRKTAVHALPEDGTTIEVTL